MPTWFKPEYILPVLIGATSGAFTIGTSALLTWNSGNVRSALADKNMESLQSDVKLIRESIAMVPLYAQRLAQLEAWQGEQKGFNGATDGRMMILERAKDVAANDIATIKAASGSKMH